GRLLAAVCAALGAHLGLPGRAVRGARFAFALLGGAGALVYLWMWVLAPWGAGAWVATRRRGLTTPSTRPQRGGSWTSAETRSGQSLVQEEAATAAEQDPRAEALFSTALSRAASPASAPSSAPSPTVSPVVAPGHGDRRQWPVAELLLGGALLVAGAGLVL